jgi:hypothetical protein
VAAREVMEEPVAPYTADPRSYGTVAPTALTAEVTAEIATALAAARHHGGGGDGLPRELPL